jgi:Na+-transporting methylmalonyl-CoA/oxaloacetate decarboxylase gamma subunit
MTFITAAALLYLAILATATHCVGKYVRSTVTSSPPRNRISYSRRRFLRKTSEKGQCILMSPGSLSPVC